MNGNGEVEEGTGKLGGKLSSFYSYKNTFDESNTWVDVPKTGEQLKAKDLVLADTLLQ